MSEKKVVKKKAVKAKAPATTKSSAKKVKAVKPVKSVKKTKKRVTKKVSGKKTQKVTPKKSVTKKAKTTKKRVVKKPDMLKKCATGKEFVLCNDDKIWSVLDLAEELGKIDEHVYHHHVNEERNDFSNWIRGVFKSQTLANKIRHLNKHDAMIEIYKYLINSLRR